MVLTVANTDTSLPALLTPPASVDPKHRILDNLTEAQSEGVKELQRRIRDMFARGDDELDGIPLRDEEAWATAKECCWRFLKANRFDVDKAEAALMKTLQWRREYRPTEISPVEIEEESKSGKAFWSGYDRIGRPILHLTTAKLKSSDTNRLIRFFVWNLENSSKLSPEGIFQVTVTANTKGLTMFNTLPIPDTIKLVSIIQTHYPEKLGCSIDFDPTWVMWALMSIMMAFMDDATKSKMHLASSKSESVNYKIKKKQKTSECPSTRTGFPCPPAAWRRRAARRTTLAAAPSCPRRWATRCRQATFWATLPPPPRPPPLALALNHNLSHNQQHTNIDLTASNPTLNVLNVSGTPQFTSAMEIAGRKSPISFPSKSPSHSRATSKTRAEKESPISNKQLNQTSASVPAGPVATPAFADFNQFRGSSGLAFLNSSIWSLNLSVKHSVNDTLQKAFPFNSGVRPVRKLMTLHDAQLKFGKDPKAALAGLIEAKSWRAIGILAATVISKSLDAR
ncbi:hypothetical protein BDR26DRAFT_1002666 [Obelidium mucronatum]|nr:hypothetical protein BDR26DRAFT_1002666 [Obelidium mucronatum]